MLRRFPVRLFPERGSYRGMMMMMMMMTTTTTFELFPMSSRAMKKKYIDSARIRVGFFKRLMSRNKDMSSV